MVLVLVLVLRKELDDTKPEPRRHSHYANKRKRSSVFEFSDDPASVKAKAGRILDDATRMKRTT
jgi:hypothetical protein